MKDLEKRRRVMQRSMRLGHCVCDPRKACPCDLLRERDVCTCAGERLDVPAGPVRLTHLVENPGCASKIDQAALKQVLNRLPALEDPRVLVGVPAGDDAGVFRLNGDLALVQTVDVFSPSVDDPYVFGQIAAANSLSDVYAMGGRPITALSVIGFPIREAPDNVMHEMLRGGIDKMAEAKVPVIGGHSINDKEIKAGFAVTGLVDPSRMVTNAGAQVGDVLILTKPVGTGIIAFAAQIGRAPEGALEAITRSMAALNKTASELMLEFRAHVCTDVTGFGLIGHLAEMASASRVDAEIIWDDIPLFPGVLECLAEGIIPGGVERNRESSGGRVEAGEGLEPVVLDLCFDAQTSGGLLIAIPEARAADLLARLHEAGVSEAAIVGRALAEGIGRLAVRTTGSRRIPAPKRAEPAPGPVVPAAQSAVEATEPAAACCADEQPADEVCCADGAAPAPAAPAASGVSHIQRAFQDFMKRANAPGALDVTTKQAIALALSVLSKCEPCVKDHIKKARQMGFTQEEIDEAAWMAVAFGGSPVMMFYRDATKA